MGIGGLRMQDRFKFKGYWYNDTQKEWWVYDKPEFITGDGTAEIWYDTEGGAEPELPSDADLHLCQCTGLKDKNGKLIYERDILRSEEYPFKNEESYNYAAEVLWDDASATFYYYTFRISTNVVGRAEGNTGNLNDYEWEVIGNRYENPELLED